MASDKKVTFAFPDITGPRHPGFRGSILLRFQGFSMSPQARYTILGEIASGSTATVFLAEDSVLRRKIALKKLHPHLWTHSETVRRFEKEAVAIASLSHENIIKVYDFASSDKGFFLAMEYVEGASLEHLLKQHPAGLPGLTALSAFHQLLSGLAAAHSAGIYHRDIKPSNVLVDLKGCVRIVDFGLAFLSQETSITRTGSYLGTPGYSAPEQADGREATDRTDIFSLGILFYRCLTGSLPFGGDTPHAVLRAIMEKTPAKAVSLNRKIVPGLPELVESMLAKDPRERPGALECIRALEGLAGKLGFPFEPRRLAACLADPAPHHRMENNEISGHFLLRARQARGQGEARKALKEYALAEAFCDAPERIRLEAEELLKKLRLRSRKKILAGVLACSALLTAVAGWLANRPPVAKPGPAAAPASFAPASPAQSRLGAMPGAILPEPAAMPAMPAESVPRGPESPSGSLLRAGRMTGSGNADPPAPAILPAPAPDSAAPAPVQAGNPAAAGPAGGMEADTHHGYLVVKTSPPFAKLFLDGREAGVTPTKTPLQVGIGPHELILEHEGCLPMHTTFEIAPSETTSLRLILEHSKAERP
jgi:eukaryotic-like serine/threonine-protein kinase